ncbi:putative carboxypeptidase S1 [Trichodelitschia bisporula]|uniref:Carboxypeptidase n=1 Tax=Trichodelitschia bisporula TaxID=703511 RepID=A0A6G1HSI8_9PEZI|nr:putative carboxypeptidase S1 [Trichodelitschia bisporula]
MRRRPVLVAFLSLAGASASAAPASGSLPVIRQRSTAKVEVFEHAATSSRMEYVSNSGVCESTPGVNQRSGYFQVGDNMNMWFWFFEARHNPQNAPLVTWFNGGPGCSSMIGLFQEHGPCQFYNGSDTPANNPYSWNEHANMLYIDQPIGVGFSYGTNNVDSTKTASPYVWALIQAFYANFKEYKSREFGIWTESYGGHYGPEFARYIMAQNSAIEAGKVKGEKINLVALGVNNGWIHPSDNYQALIDYAATNNHKKLISAQQQQTYTKTMQSRCLPALQKCWQTDSNRDCQNAVMTCKSAVESPLSRGNFDVYDVRTPPKSGFPPEMYIKYLQKSDIQQRIGAKKKYDECPNAPLRNFADFTDSRSFLGALSNIVKANVTTLIWAGDADWICNWMGNLATANEVKFPGQAKFKAAQLRPYKVRGVTKGEYKSVDNFSFLRIYQAGHEAAYYQPEASLQLFVQTMKRQAVFST